MAAEPTLYLRANRPPRIEAGHPWVFRSEVAREAGGAEDGGTVAVRNHAGRFLGRGYFNNRSEIVARILTREDEPLDREFFRKRLVQAAELRREAVRGTDAYRLVFSEGDRMPGLVVDVYHDVFVVQLNTLGMERRREVVLDLLEELFSPAGIYERSEGGSRRREGLEPRTGPARGSPPGEVEFGEDELRFTAAIAAGQKTGFFLDQRENRRLAAPHLRGRVLDLFCYTGAFACRAGKAAGRVVAADISPEALLRAKDHFGRNGLAGRAHLLCANSFELLRAFEARRARFDAIVLDPPALARSHAALPGARRGYKDLNLRALRLLDPGGVLATSSCSARLSREEFLSLLAEAAHDARRELRLLAEGSQPPDHPVLLGVPETRYLKFFLWRVLG